MRAELQRIFHGKGSLDGATADDGEAGLVDAQPRVLLVKCLTISFREVGPHPEGAGDGALLGDRERFLGIELERAI